MSGRRVRGLAVGGLALVLGCSQDSIVRVLGPENDPQTVITPAEFRFSATDLRNVNDRETWTWPNSAPQAVPSSRQLPASRLRHPRRAGRGGSGGGLDIARATTWTPKPERELPVTGRSSWSLPLPAAAPTSP